MRRIILLGMTVIVGVMLGCSGGGVADGQPRNTDPNAKPKVQRKGMNQGAKTANAID